MRVLFCIGINQNFFDLPADGITTGHVWQATVSMMDSLKALPGVDFIADFDDDAHLVGPSDGWPWTCNLFRTTPVGDGEAKLWRFAKVEARMGRALTVREDVELPD
jgi:hypothetical protein